MSGAERVPERGRLASRLGELFDAEERATGKRPSYEHVARTINNASNGFTISAPYVWEMATGKSENPRLHHLEALAFYFGVSVTYLVDDEEERKDDEEEGKVARQLALLQALKNKDVRGVALEVATAGLSPESLATLTEMISFLKARDGSRSHGEG